MEPSGSEADVLAQTVESLSPLSQGLICPLLCPTGFAAFAPSSQSSNQPEPEQLLISSGFRDVPALGVSGLVLGSALMNA